MKQSIRNIIQFLPLICALIGVLVSYLSRLTGKGPDLFFLISLFYLLPTTNILSIIFSNRRLYSSLAVAFCYIVFVIFAQIPNRHFPYKVMDAEALVFPMLVTMFTATLVGTIVGYRRKK